MSFSVGDLLGKPRGRSSFSGDLEGYGGEGSEDGYHSPWGPCWGICRCSSARNLIRLWRHAPFSTGALLRIMGGFVHWELSRDS